MLLWQSNELYRTAPTVDDEVRNLLARFRESIFDEATLLFERLETQLGTAVPTFLTFGSWIGSDRDGNANVAPDAILAAHERARAFVLRTYVTAIEELQVRFSQDAVRGARRAGVARVDRARLRPNWRTCATRSARVKRPNRIAASSRSCTGG